MRVPHINNFRLFLRDKGFKGTKAQWGNGINQNSGHGIALIRFCR